MHKAENKPSSLQAVKFVGEPLCAQLPALFCQLCWEVSFTLVKNQAGQTQHTRTLRSNTTHQGQRAPLCFLVSADGQMPEAGHISGTSQWLTGGLHAKGRGETVSATQFQRSSLQHAISAWRH